MAFAMRERRRVRLPVPSAVSGSARRVRLVLLGAVIALPAVTGLDIASAQAATVCSADVCVIVPDATLATPLGPVTVTVSAGNVVTVHLEPAQPNTLVLGLPFTL